MFRWFPRPAILGHAKALVSPQVLAVALAALLLGGSALGALAATDAGGLRSAVGDAVRSNDADDDGQDFDVGPTPDGSPDDGDGVSALSETPDSADSTDDTSDVDDSTVDDSEDSGDDTSDSPDNSGHGNADHSPHSLDDSADSPDDSPDSPDDSADSPDDSADSPDDSPDSPDDSPDSPDDED